MMQQYGTHLNKNATCVCNTSTFLHSIYTLDLELSSSFNVQAFPFALPHGIMLLLPSISDVHLKRLGRVLEDRARLPAEVNKSLFSLTKSVYSGPSDCYSRGTGGGWYFKGLKTVGSLTLTPYLHVEPRTRMYGTILPHPHTPSWCTQGQFRF